MNKLKKWVLAPVACLAVLYIWLLAGSRIGYIWTFAIESVVILAVIFAFSSKFNGETGKKITKDIITVLGGIWGIIAIANIGTWLGSKIGFLWAFLIIGGIIAVGAFVLDPKKAKEYFKKRTSTRVVIGAIIAIFAVPTIYVWLGFQIGFFLLALLVSLVAILALTALEKRLGEQKKLTVGVFAFLACVWILAVVIWMYRIPPAPPMDKTNDVYVQAQAQEVLKNYLKSPSTATFPAPSHVAIRRFTNKAPNRAPNEAFEVSSYVDSQNGFGAMIRSNWTVVFEYVGTMMRINKVVIDGEILKDSSQE